MPPSEAERLAVLETRATDLERSRDVMFDKLEDHDEALEDIRTGVHDIRGTMRQYKGFVGGVTFTLTAVGVVIGALLSALWKKLAG